MRQFILTLSLLLFISAHAQVATDGVSGSDVRQIIINYKEHKVPKFIIKQKEKTNCRKSGFSFMLFYNFINDSTLYHAIEGYDDTSIYFIRNNDFVSEYELRRMKEGYNSPTKYFNIDYDSLSYNISRLYKIENGDSILMQTTLNKNDSLGRLLEDIYLRTTNRDASHKSLWEYIGDTVIYQSFMFYDEGWRLRYESQEYILKDSIKSAFKDIYTERTVSHREYFNQTSVRISNGTNLTTRIVHYNKDHLIIAIVWKMIEKQKYDLQNWRGRPKTKTYTTTYTTTLKVSRSK